MRVPDAWAYQAVQLIEQGHDIAEGLALRSWEHLRWTDPQEAYLADDSPIVLVRGGNQIGKTTSFLVDLICRCRGIHPWQTVRHKPPINAILVSESWDQMGQAGGFLHKLWGLLPKDEINLENGYEPGRGIRGKPPRINFIAGPGKGSAITLATFKQGASRVAGSTVHYVGTDEPPPARMLAELLPRLLRYGGVMRLNFTPVLDMPDQSELRELVQKGQVSEYNPRLTEANCYPRGAPRPWVWQRQIDALIALWPDAIVQMRRDGSWEPRTEKNWLSAWDEAVHLRGSRPPAGSLLGIGIDHGAQAGKQAAVLFAVASVGDLVPYVWFLDEDVSTGRSSIPGDARAIKAMLERNGLTWSDIDVWVGDRPTTADRLLVIKDNAQLRRALAEEYRAPLEHDGARKPFPTIETARKGAGSIEQGLRKWNGLLAHRDHDGTVHCVVNPRCVQVAAFCARWQGKAHDPLKNAGDAGRYILNRMVAEVGTPTVSFGY